MDILSIAAVVLLAAGSALAAWMLWVEPRRFRIWRRSLPLKTRRDAEDVSLVAGRLPPLRILHITDTHLGGSDKVKMRFLRRVARETCDLAVLTGDLLDRPLGLEACFELAEMLNPRLGAYAVLGGHDHFFTEPRLGKYFSVHRAEPAPPELRNPNPVRDLITGMERRGVTILADEHRRIEGPGGASFAVVGLRDAFVFDPDYDRAWGNLPADEPTIVLAHSPDSLPEIADRGADLAFFGHTHGGQVRFPLVGAVVTRSHLSTRRARGIFREQETVFTLNHGVGAGRGSNFRLLCPPEVTVLRLCPDEQGPEETPDFVCTQ